MAMAMQVCEGNRRALEESAKCYKPCASNAALLYFAISDMATVSPMYQFSLAAFRSVFLLSIQKAAKSDKVDERVHHLIDHHTYAVFKYASRCERQSPTVSLLVLREARAY
jgi:dynein heavy chain, axonemal